MKHVRCFYRDLSKMKYLRFYYLLFQVHFAHDMWENNRVDGKRKLKINAVPTIFGSEAKKIVSSKNQKHIRGRCKFMEKHYIFI